MRSPDFEKYRSGLPESQIGDVDASRWKIVKQLIEGAVEQNSTYYLVKRPFDTSELADLIQYTDSLDMREIRVKNSTNAIPIVLIGPKAVLKTVSERRTSPNDPSKHYIVYTLPDGDIVESILNDTTGTPLRFVLLQRVATTYDIRPRKEPPFSEEPTGYRYINRQMTWRLGRDLIDFLVLTIGCRFQLIKGSVPSAGVDNFPLLAVTKPTV